MTLENEVPHLRIETLLFYETVFERGLLGSFENSVGFLTTALYYATYSTNVAQEFYLS